MANEPKLHVFTLELQADNSPTFYKLFKSGTNLSESDSSVFMNMFGKFLNKLDQEKFHRNTKKGKAFTGHEKDPDSSERVAILPDPKNHVIEGTIEGGKFGGDRGKAALDSKKIKEKVKEDDVITEKYYFFLHLPLDSETGILMMQSYSNDSVTDMFLGFIKKFLKNEVKGYKPAVSQKYVPPSIIEEFKNDKDSVIKSFTFRTKMLLGHIDNKTVAESPEEFMITVKAESVKGIKKGRFDNWKNSISSSIFSLGKTTKDLSNFTSKKASVKNEKLNKSTSFELSTKFDIRPVIYLDESKIKFTGRRIIDFDSLKKYCYKLLKEIEKDVYKL